MRKIIIYDSIILLLGVSFSFAQGQKSITLTTYYPSPYGVYREMRSQRMAIGDTYYDPSQHCWSGGPCAYPDINDDADLIVEGNVGIGTTEPDPQYKLDVAGYIMTESIKIEHAQQPWIWLRENDNNKNWFIISDDFKFFINENNNNIPGSSRLTIIPGGYVGIGTDTPGYKLDVAGDARISGNLTVTNDVSITKLDLNSGDILNANKITANQIDPVFKIDGKKYVTFAAEIVGSKVLVVGQGKLNKGVWKKDLSQQKQGSDLWLFYNIAKPDSIIPFVFPQQPANLYGYIKGSEFRVELKDGSPQAKFSYLLIGERIDYQRGKYQNQLPEKYQAVTATYIDVDKYKKPAPPEMMGSSNE